MVIKVKFASEVVEKIKWVSKYEKLLEKCLYIVRYSINFSYYF